MDAFFGLPLRLEAQSVSEGTSTWYPVALLANIPKDKVPAISPSQSYPPVSYEPRFFGRDAILQSIVQAFQHAQVTDTTTIPTVVLTGMPGLGKSELARAFVAHYGCFFQGGVFWIKCADTYSIAASIANAIKSPVLQFSSTVEHLPFEERIRLVQASWHKSMPRLLIFDNCEDENTLQQWRPLSGGCWLTVTSRRGGLVIIVTGQATACSTA